eukprot:TRINITY_DN1018_c0_g1_i4.p2 TRINITY_DN1018_c0_g1~~TRINITY_DN1018_c0_g1_i4.p2  ORF type:complete len:248 (-),score=76.18 TRINITY_DN1018_c0_g1_i4:1744-2487(-)
MTDEGNKGDNDTKLVWADEEESDEEDNMLKVSNDMQNAWGKIEEEPKEKEETEKEEKAEETVEKTGPEDTSGDNTQRNDSRRSPDGDRRGGDSKFFEPKLRAPPRVSNPLPDSPPYRAYVGNIKHAATQDDVGNYFDDEGCGVEEVIILTSGPDNKPKGSAFVIFKELEGLKKKRWIWMVIFSWDATSKSALQIRELNEGHEEMIITKVEMIITIEEMITREIMEELTVSKKDPKPMMNRDAKNQFL